MLEHNYLIYIFAALTGLIMGSFMNVLIYRVPRGLSIVSPPSACPVCGKKIAWYSNIPLLSYIVQAGKCKSCRTRISLRYPVVELITALVFFLVVYRYNEPVLIFKYCIFSFLLLVSAFTDIDTRMDSHFDSGYIPDHYTVGGVLAGYVISLFAGDVSIFESFAGSGAGAFSIFITGYLFKVIRKIEGIGDGDALLLGMVGSFLGVQSILFVLTLSALIGSIAGIIIITIKKDRNYGFPFGPMIALAALIYVFTGGEIISAILF